MLNLSIEERERLDREVMERLLWSDPLIRQALVEQALQQIRRSAPSSAPPSRRAGGG